MSVPVRAREGALPPLAEPLDEGRGRFTSGFCVGAGLDGLSSGAKWKCVKHIVPSTLSE